MSTVLIIAGVLAALVLAFLRALAFDEIRGRVQRRVNADVEATIASLPPELQAEWGEEWRAELATLSSMPLSAIAFARGLRKTAGQLVLSPEPAPAWRRPRLRPLGRLQRFRRVYIENPREPEILRLLALMIVGVAGLLTGAIIVIGLSIFSIIVPIQVFIVLALSSLLALGRIWMRR